MTTLLQLGVIGVLRYIFHTSLLTRWKTINLNLSPQQVKLHTEKKVGQDFSEFKAISYKTQPVTGINYFIKVSQKRSTPTPPLSQH